MSEGSEGYQPSFKEKVIRRVSQVKAGISGKIKGPDTYQRPTLEEQVRQIKNGSSTIEARSRPPSVAEVTANYIGDAYSNLETFFKELEATKSMVDGPDEGIFFTNVRAAPGRFADEETKIGDQGFSLEKTNQKYTFYLNTVVKVGDLNSEALVNDVQTEIFQLEPNRMSYQKKLALAGSGWTDPLEYQEIETGHIFNLALRPHDAQNAGHIEAKLVSYLTQARKIVETSPAGIDFRSYSSLR